MRLRRVIGLMSGTSLDGIDAALLVTDGREQVQAGASLTVPYDPAFRQKLRGVLGGRGDVAAVEQSLTELHAQAVRALDAGEVDLIGFHGHTILHRPPRTWQIGDGALLARLTGIDVVNDFRSADVAAGGEGAPLVPLYHRALAHRLERPLVVLNIGGVANLTWIGDGPEEILAFDTGPGNALIDDWMLAETGQTHDANGALARTGRVDTARVQSFLADPYFARKPPKSLDRDDFTRYRPVGLSAADGAATLTAMTAAAIAAAAAHFPAPARRWLVTGGGRHNSTLLTMLTQRLNGVVAPVESVGWQGDALEAQAFAYLAARAVEGLPLSLPSTTGAKIPTKGGRHHPAR